MIGTYFLLKDYTIDQVVMRNCGDVCGKKTGWHKASEIIDENEKIEYLLCACGTNPKCYVNTGEEYAIRLIVGGTYYPNGERIFMLDGLQEIEPKQIKKVYIERNKNLICIAERNDKGELELL